MTVQQKMAYPAYMENNLAFFLDLMLPLFLVLSFSFSVPPIMKRIVHEKQTGVKVSVIPKSKRITVAVICTFLRN